MFKILVVEDDRNISDLIRMYLDKEGFEVRIAYDGGKAVEEFEKQKPDLVLCMDPFTADLGSAGRKLKEVLKELSARGSAVLLLSGSLEKGYMLADRFLMVQNGTVKKSSESNEF